MMSMSSRLQAVTAILILFKTVLSSCKPSGVKLNLLN